MTQKRGGPLSTVAVAATSRRVWLGGMTTVLILTLLPSSSYVAAVSLIQEEWGINNTQAGFVFSAFLIGYVGAALLLVPLTDRFPARHVVLTSAVVGSLGNLLFPLVAYGVVSGAIARVLAGVGLVGVYVPGTRIVAERFAGGGRGTAVGLFVSGFYLGSAASLVLTGLLLASLDWRQAYLVIALTSLAAPLLAYPLVRGHSGTQRGGSPGWLTLGVLKNQATRLVILGYSMHAWELYLVRMWLPPFFAAVLMARGYDPTTAAATGATVVGLLTAIGAIAPFLGGILSDRVGRTASAGVIFAVSGLCSFVIGWMTHMPWASVVAVALVYGFFVGFDSAIYSTAVTEVATPHLLGSTLAVHTFVGFGSGLLSPIAFGAIRDVTSPSLGWGLGFSTGGIAAIVAVGAMAWLRTLPESRLLARGRR